MEAIVTKHPPEVSRDSSLEGTAVTLVKSIFHIWSRRIARVTAAGFVIAVLVIVILVLVIIKLI